MLSFTKLSGMVIFNKHKYLLFFFLYFYFYFTLVHVMTDESEYVVSRQ